MAIALGDELALSASIVIRWAWPDEQERLRYLFGRRVPRLTGDNSLVVVHRGQVERFVAAVVWTTIKRDEHAGQTVFSYYALPAWQSNSVVVELFRTLIEVAKQQAISSLWSAETIPANRWDAVALRQAGFDIVAEYEFYELSTAQIARRVQQFQRRLPPNRSGQYGAVPLDETNMQRAWQFVAPYRALSKAQFIHGCQTGLLRQCSALLMEGDSLRGVLLATQPQSGVMTVLLLAVDAPTRAVGIAAATLYEFVIQRCTDQNLATVRFQLGSNVPQSLRRHAQRFGAQLRARRYRFGIEGKEEFDQQTDCPVIETTLH